MVQHFLLKMYPNLAKAYPTNKLPDLRGEFIRGWDDGRGVDAGVLYYLHRMMQYRILWFIRAYSAFEMQSGAFNQNMTKYLQA
ncbi:hypothetical protein LQQ80_25935 (plasmid) [Escherichia coli]|nr:hypothetical protein LQQ80_25935 [Escherichia coli]